METSLSVLFYGKKAKATTAGLIPIYLRITIRGERFEISTKRYLDPSKWSVEAQKAKGNIEETRSLNSYLDTLKAKVYANQREMIQDNIELTAENFKNKWLGISDRKHLLFEVFEHHNIQLEELIGSDFSAGTLTLYKTTLLHVRNFVKWKFNVSDIHVNNLNFEFITELEFWLKSVKKIGHNTTLKYISNLKKIINICRKNGWIQRDPFIGYKMTKREVVREHLTEDEIQIIANKHFFNDRLNQVRDIFLFSCFTGLAYADVKKLKRSEICVGIDGENWIFTQRKKTETPSRIPLLPFAQNIVEKYKDHPKCLHADLVLPVHSNQKMNAYLKEIADLSGINKNLTFHIARHTFATTVTLSNGVPIESVSKMLGHKSLKSTQHYAKILDIKVSHDMQILKNKFSVKESNENGLTKSA